MHMHQCSNGDPGSATGSPRVEKMKLRVRRNQSNWSLQDRIKKRRELAAQRENNSGQERVSLKYAADC